jgi:hypothetical protein
MPPSLLLLFRTWRRLFFLKDWNSIMQRKKNYKQSTGVPLMKGEASGKGRRKLPLGISSIAQTKNLVFTPLRVKTEHTTCYVSHHYKNCLGQESRMARHPCKTWISPHQEANLYNIEVLFPKHHHVPGALDAPKGGHPKHVPSDDRKSFASPLAPVTSSAWDDANKCFAP